MARDDNDTDDLMKEIEASQRLYADNVSHGKRLSASFNSSTIVDSEDKIFGMFHVSKGAANLFRVAFDQMLPHVADYIGNKSTQFAHSVGRNVFRIEDNEKLLQFGKKFSKPIAYGTLFLPSIMETSALCYQTSVKLAQLHQVSAPVLKANGQSAIGGVTSKKNSVIDYQRQKILNSAGNDFARIVARSIGTLPGIMILKNKQDKRAAQSELEAEIELISRHGSEEDLDKFIDRQISNAERISSKQIDRQNNLLSKRRAEYHEKFNRFKANNSESVRNELNQEIELGGDLTAYIYRYADRNSSGKNFEELPPAIQEKTLNKIVEGQLREKFSKQEGPFDSDWIYDRRNSVKTHEEMIRASYDEIAKHLNEELSSKKKHHSSNSHENELFQQGIQLMASIGAEIASGLLTKDTKNKLKQLSACEMIENLCNNLKTDQQPDKITEESDRHANQTFDYAMYVHRIFNRDVSDVGKSEIDKRYFPNAEKFNWSDQALQKMNDADLTSYEVAIKHISQYIRDGKMSPAALVGLVGEHRIVSETGKSFGTLKSGSEEDIKKSIVQEIDKQCALLKPNRQMTAEEKSAAMAGYTFTPEELKAAFGANGLQDDARAFVFMLIDAHTPDISVLKEITGLEESEIKKLRQDSQASFATNINAAVQEIAKEIEHSPDAIKKYNLSEHEVESLVSVAHKAEKSGHCVIDALNTQMKKELETAVTNVLLEDGVKNDHKLWQKKIKPRTEQLQKEEQFADKTTHRATHEGRFADGDIEPFEHHSKRHSNHHAHTGRVNHSRVDPEYLGLT